MNAPTWLMLFLFVCAVGQTRGQGPTEPPGIAPGKYCCQMPEAGYVGCILFKEDGSYQATANFHNKGGASRGTWKRVGNQIVLKTQEETGSLVGYLTRFSINGTGKSLTWLPKTPQDFSLR